MTSGSVDWGEETPNPPPVELTPKQPPRFHIFLAYNSRDAKATNCMHAIARSLEEAQFRAWNDVDDTRIGEPSVDELLQGIEQSACFAMLLGSEGPGRWQGETELLSAMERRNLDPRFRVFAVRLPGYPGEETLPKALRPYTWADLSEGFDDDGNLTPEGFQEVRRAIELKTRREVREGEDEARTGLAEPGKNRALVCGIAHYGHKDLGDLNSSLNDIEKVADALRAAGAPDGDWDITPGKNLTYEQLVTALSELFTAKAAPEDKLLFYFSGHGRAPGGASYLCAANTDPEMLGWKAISDTQLSDLLRHCPAAGKVVILDCCEGASISNSAFEHLDDKVAVIVATKGLAGDGSHEGELSTFARRLVDVIPHPGPSGEYGLDVRGLVDALKQPDTEPLLFGRGTAIRLTRAAPAVHAAPESTEPPFPIEMPVPDEPDRRTELELRLVLLRQLGSSVEGLLAMAEKRTTFPEELIDESVKVLSAELCRLMSDESYRELTGRVRAREHVRCELSFRGEDDRALFGDLPWEYLALHLDKPRPKLGVERTFAANPKGGSSRGTEIGWFSSMDVADPTNERLTSVAEAALHDAGLTLAPTRSTTYTTLYSAPDTKRGLVLQLPVQLVERAGEQVVQVTLADELAVTAEDLAQTLDRKRTVTWVLIETVIGECGKKTALALRRLAAELAEQLNGRTVIAIGHPLAYLNAMEPTQPVFLVKFIERVRNGMSPEASAYLARDDTISPMIKASMIGVPVIMRPKRVEDAGRLRPSTSRDASRLRA